jgi:hypothetical protein
LENWLSCGIGGVWISSEVVVEGNIFLKNDYDVFDGSFGLKVIGIAGDCAQDSGIQQHCRHTEGEYFTNHYFSSRASGIIFGLWTASLRRLCAQD